MQSEYEGIRKLRRGVGFIILVTLLIEVIGLILAISLFLTPFTAHHHLIKTLRGIIVAFAVIVILGVIIGIVGLLNIRDGFRILRDLGKDVGIGYTGVTLYFVSLGLAVLGAILLLVIVGIFVILIAALLILVSNILIGVGFYKVGEIYNEGTTKIGGILVAIPIDIVSFIGYILVYIGLGKIRPAVQHSYSPIQPQIYQVGQGIIRGNGYALISLYSSTQAMVLSARIEGTTIASTNINPVVLQPGQNTITIKFDNVSQLTPGTTYLITLAVNVGGNISEIKTAAVYQP